METIKYWYFVTSWAMVTERSNAAVNDWWHFPDWPGGIDLESCGQSQWPISTAAEVWGHGGAGPLHLWPDVQRADAAQPGAVQVGASSQTSLTFLWLAPRLRMCSCFRDAVSEVGSVQCSRPTTQELRSLAEAAFGDPSSWEAAQVSTLGNIIGNVTFCLPNFFACIWGNNSRSEKKTTCLFNSLSWIGPLSAGLFVAPSL